MTLTNTTQGYGSVAKFLHWFIFLLLLAMIIFGYFLEDFPKDVQPVTYNVHKLTGLGILLLMAVRALWAAVNAKPVLPDTKPWERMAERTVHYLLYLVVFAMPIVGWIGSCAAGRPPHIGDWQLMLPIAQNETVVDVSFEMHEWLAIVLIVLVSIHFLAALFHQFVKKDNVLRRMLPSA